MGRWRSGTGVMISIQGRVAIVYGYTIDAICCLKPLLEVDECELLRLTANLGGCQPLLSPAYMCWTDF